MSRWSRRRRAPTGELAALAATPTWMYEWDLGGGVRTSLLSPQLMSVHTTVSTVLAPVVTEALASAGRRSTAVDLACSEGWHAHRLLEYGAGEVVGYDIRAENVQRAEMIRDHLGVSARRLTFATADVFDVTGRFDVVLCLGLVYHLENPVGALRVARALTRGVCIVESQLTEQTAAIVHGWGGYGEYLEAPASWAAFYEPDELQAHHPIASHGGVVSLIPNRAALLQALTAAGFSRVAPLAVAADLDRQYVEGHRLVVAAWP